jgi:hypothetical protein
MHRAETKTEKEVTILCSKPTQQTKLIKNQCIGLKGEFV